MDSDNKTQETPFYLCSFFTQVSTHTHTHTPPPHKDPSLVSFFLTLKSISILPSAFHKIYHTRFLVSLSGNYVKYANLPKPLDSLFITLARVSPMSMSFFQKLHSLHHSVTLLHYRATIIIPPSKSKP
jgi:hypothetical protein